MRLPIYVIVGDQPVSFERTEDGGGKLRGWDFELGKMTREAADWDDIVGIEKDVRVKARGTNLSEGDWSEVTKKEFDARVAKLRREFKPKKE